MNIGPGEIYERARQMASQLCWTVSLQVRRVRSSEPEDEEFPARIWADYNFLINTLSRLRRCAVMATKIPSIATEIQSAISEFDRLLPDLQRMRNALEHIDDYSLDKGRDSKIYRAQLQVASMSGDEIEWLDCRLNTEAALEASSVIFGALVSSAENAKEAHNNWLHQTRRL